MTGRIGATYHISFPVVTRASFGIYGSLWPIFNRAGMACVWYGVQAWIGGECVTLILRAIWPQFNALGTTKNTMSPSSGTNTRDFVGFFLFWLFSLPAIWVRGMNHLLKIPIALG
jgi:NCS1 family nucleobase:cation symporter-1